MVTHLQTLRTTEHTTTLPPLLLSLSGSSIPQLPLFLHVHLCTFGQFFTPSGSFSLYHSRALRKLRNANYPCLLTLTITLPFSYSHPHSLPSDPKSAQQSRGYCALINTLSVARVVVDIFIPSHHDSRLSNENHTVLPFTKKMAYAVLCLT
jgi:hypothetical protein